MSTSGEEIKVLLTADLAGLQAGMAAGAESVETASAAITAAVEESAAAVKASTASIGESAEQAAARIKAMVRASLEQAEADHALGESERSLAERMGLRIEATDAQIDATAAAIAAQNEQMAGAAAYADAEAEAAAATDVATVATDANTEAMVVNAGVAREVGVLMGELARGNTARLEGSLFTLGNRAGLTTMLFTPMGAAIAAAGAAVIAFGVAAVKGAEEQAQFNNAVLMTGGAAGVSSGAVQEMASRIGEATGSFGDANEAMLALVKSGRFTADQLQQVGQAAVQMSQLTGESVDKAVQQFVKLREKPVEAAIELNNQYHFLTAAIFDQIEALQRQGDVQGAAAVGQQALSEALAKRAREAEQQLNSWGRVWHKLGEEASWAWDAMKGLTKSDSVDQQIDKVNAKLTVAKNILATLQGSSGATGALMQQTQQVNDLTNQLDKLVETRDKMRAKDASEAANQAAQQQTIQDIAAQDKLNDSLKYTSQLEEAIAENKARVERIHKNDPGSASIKGINFDASGAVSGGEQWDAIVAKLTKEYSNLGAEARKAGQEAKKVAHEQLTDLEMQRAGTAANTAERIQADAAVLASATSLYGANSSQQKAALTQMLADEKAYDASVVRERQQAIQQQTASAINAAQAELAIKTDRINAALSLDQTHWRQAISQQAAANQQEYQLELDLLNKELALLNVKSKEHARVNAEIEKLQQRHELEMQKLNERAAIDNQKMWQSRLRPVSQAFSTAINGMIQGTNTLRQTLAHIGDSIVAKFVEMGINMVVHWAANEAAKTTATAVGTASRTTIEATAAATTKATDAATGKSQITSAAATGAAKAYQAIVGIPYVGPILAPIAAGVAFAGIEAFAGSISSARGGWERVPFDGAMTELHKDEMVLPADIANPMRRMAQQGGGTGGGGSTVIKAFDARSFKEYLRRNPGELASGMKRAQQRGHLGGKKR
ncbi:MAG: phage tail length tape measure family protein [Dyella sp.]|uniref:phage tail length tape measure family protein n=1 Tax=Dyella sp. TaxID=1869338 RepID=UPI003F7D808B